MKIEAKVFFAFAYIMLVLLFNIFTLQFYEISGVRTIPYSFMAVLFGGIGAIFCSWYKSTKIAELTGDNKE